MVNGREVRRMNLTPGEYDLDDLPLLTGHNDVQIKIRDELGNEELLDFSVLFNRTLLMPGISEWSLAGGVKAEAASEAPYYNPDIPILSGLFRRGISETFTGSIMAQTSLDASVVGLGGLLQTPYGLWNINTFSSMGPEGNVGWSVTSDFHFDTDRLWEELGSLSVGIDVEQEGFFSSLSQTTGSADRIRFTGSMSYPLPMGTTANLSGYYQFAEEEANTNFGASLSLSRVVDHTLSLNLSGSFEKSGGSYRDDQENEVNILARLNYRPSRDSYLSFQHDRNTGKTSVSTGTHLSNGDTRTSFDADFENIPQDEGETTKRTAGVSVNHSNRRFEVNASHGVQFDRLGRHVYSRRSSANFGTAIGYAGGDIAIGRPVRAGFAIMTPHKSLADSKVKVGVYKDNYRAGSDGLGPLLVSDISAYAPSNLTYDVEDAPPGYDIGTGSFQFVAPYKAGYSLSVGSEFSITAIGTLLDEGGEPVTLKAISISLEGEESKEIQSFTNTNGLFTGLGLKAGHWSITIPDRPLLTYQIDVPEDATGFYELGKLNPIEKQP
jgi:outer membrane usher protein